MKFISLPEPVAERNEVAIRGRITLDDFSEEFLASVSYWSPTDYERQWLEAAERLANGADKSAFITDMYDPADAAFIVWWPVWRMNETVYVHNQLLFLGKLMGPFDDKNPYVHIGERKTENEEGQKISEWRITAADIRRFINKVKS